LPPGLKRTELEQGLDGALNGWFGGNILPVTAAISNRWGSLDALRHRRRRPLGNIDGLIAATVLEHGLAVVTRNKRHFEELGCPV
jgi:predicted nucleic acid-binding protein